MSVKKRDNFKKALTRLSNNSQNEEMSLQEAPVSLEELEKYWEKFEEAQLEVDEETGKPGEAEMVSGQKLFFEAKIRFRIIMNTATPPPPVLNQQNAAPINMQLPAPRINTKMKIGAITHYGISTDLGRIQRFHQICGIHGVTRRS